MGRLISLFGKEKRPIFGALRKGAPGVLMEDFMAAKFSHAAYAQLVKDTFDTAMQLSTLKGGEYSGDDDRLLNFRRNAAALGLTKETIWGVYAAKHWDAIMRYIKDLQAGKDRVRLESLDGRCNDLIVYLMLFKAMLIENATSVAVGTVTGRTYDLDKKTGNEHPILNAR